MIQSTNGTLQSLQLKTTEPASHKKRLFIEKKTSVKEREEIINLAVKNEYNTLVFSLNDKFFKDKDFNYVKLIKHYAFNIEAGGRDFPVLLPRRMFLFNRDMFRMMHGKRKSDHHFCPTNPKTITAVSKHAQNLFARAMHKVTVPRIFHLLPDDGQENTWCACPACRAFTPAEQYRLAVNTAADVLAKLDSDARLVYINFGTAPEDAPHVTARMNTLQYLVSGGANV